MQNKPLLGITSGFLFFILLTSPLAIAEPKTPDFGTIHQNLPEKTTFSNQVNKQPGPPEFVPNRYIVVFEDGVSPKEVTKAKGLVPDFVYNRALNGFAGFLSPIQIEDLKQDPRVKYIVQDKIAHITEQTLPTGIDRIDAEPVSSPSSYAGNISVAILDTGIDYFHIDLNVVQRYQCLNISTIPWIPQIECKEGGALSDGVALDAHGHGSHVAGIVAALDNEFGPVGVVPGADLWAIQVLGDDGSGTYSQIIMGIDYVIENADSIDVANLSLGGPFDAALNEAVANGVDAGVVFVVAAGNEQVDASTRSPASEPKAITVSAFADFDGMPGGLSANSQPFSSCTEDQDDSFACFSNYGENIDISAPGVNIFSTYRDGLYHIGSGTSMASPHVAGAAAKLISEGVNPSDVESTLIANGINFEDSDYLVIDDDPDDISEKLLYVGNSNDDPEPVDNDGDGSTSDVDCDDNDANTYPGAPELADGKDNDCDGTVDEGIKDEEAHVSDLNWTASNKKNWNAKVFLTVYDSTNTAFSGIFVEVNFNGDSVSCTTDEFGKCQFNKTTRQDSMTFDVLSLDSVDTSEVTHTDPDGDFDGIPSVTIFRGENSEGSENDSDNGGGSGSCNPGQQRKGLC